MTGITLSPGSPRCLCRSCGCYFSNVRAFDKHRRDGACVNPATVGLVLKGGIWRRGDGGGYPTTGRGANRAITPTPAGLAANLAGVVP
ncbi:MAG: hypothetical protein JNM50_11960 [Chromatiales bacterium]|jgi:hypothetical protein|nr:hypothetical protein [Chromatiales bacterium]